MAQAGVKTPNLPLVSIIDELVGNRDKTTSRIAIDDLGTQLAGSGPVLSAINDVRDQVVGGLLSRATWADLLPLPGAVEGSGAEVLDMDVGTHLEATATGYDGASVPNAGRYSWNATWARWVRIGNNGLSAKVNVSEVGTAAAEDVEFFATAAEGAEAVAAKAKTDLITVTEAVDLDVLATELFVDAAVAALVDSSPELLNTFNEFAVALGNDPNFAATISTLIATKAPLASPALTGAPTAPTAAPGTDTTQIASTAFVEAMRVALAAAVATKSPIADPTFTGVPAAPTAAPGTNTTQIATAAFVQAAVAALVDTSPAALDTLNELATALGDDANFATSMTAALAGKATLAQGQKAHTAVQPAALGDLAGKSSISNSDIADGAVYGPKLADRAATNAKLANMGEGTVKGRPAGADTGPPVDLTPAEAKAAMGLGTAADAAAEDFTPATLLSESTAASIPGLGDVAALSHEGPDGKVSEATRKSDGRKFVLGKSGKMDGVAVDGDLVDTFVEGKITVAGFETAEIRRQADGKVSGFRTKLDHEYRLHGGTFLPRHALSFDIVIYGEGLAALSAMRMAKSRGHSVCLLCPRDRAGGMMSGGISDMDVYSDGVNPSAWRKYTGGYTRAFIMEIMGVHHDNYGTMKRFQARAAQDIADRWVTDYADHVIYNCRVHDRFQSLVMDEKGKRIKAIITPQGPVRGQQFIDASYTGDVLRSAGVSWTATHEATSAEEPEGGFNWAGRSEIATGLDVEATSIAMGYDPIPDEAFDLTLVERITDISGLQGDGTAVDAPMAFHCRAEITNAGNRIPFSQTPPAGYDRRRYIIATAEALADGATDIWDILDAQGDVLPMVNGQTQITIYNTNGGLTGAYRAPGGYADATWEERDAIAADVMAAWTGYLYFFATDPHIATILPALQADVQSWGWPREGWPNSPYGHGIPHMPYERETIRMVNDHVLNRPALQVSWDDVSAPSDIIAIFRYKFDTKYRYLFAIDAEGDGSNITLVHEGFASSGVSAAYAIPLSACLPRRSECRNFGVAWCVSTTGLAWRSLRMEPSGGFMGEGVAAAASLAIYGNVAIQDVAYADVAEILLQNQSILSV